MAEIVGEEAAGTDGGTVFISYASRDVAVATALVDALESAGHRCWIAPRDVRAGAQYADAIIRAINSARAIVLVLSADSIISSHVGREVERASSKKRPIIALRIDAAPLTPALEYFLSESQWVEARSGKMQAAYAKLIDAIGDVGQSEPLSAPVVAPATPAKATNTPALLTAGMAIVAIALAALLLPGEWIRKHAAPDQPVAAANAAPKSIAVLPFENRSAKQDDVYFTDGIHDDVLTQLTKIGAMKVIARTSVEQFRDTRLTTREIGAKLGVTHVLEGGVQRAGDRVRVTVQLIDVTTDAHVWAESYDRNLTAANIFAIQSETATAIASALKTALTPSEQKSLSAIPTRNLEAWEAYQLGKQLRTTAASSTSNLAGAANYFQKAVDLDPGFALAYAALADTLLAQIGWSGIPKEINVARAEQLVRKALELGPNLAESWEASAGIAEAKEQYDRAEAEYRKVIALNPGYARAYRYLADLLRLQGRLEEALIYSSKGLDLDPLSPGAVFSNARILSTSGRFNEAEAGYRKVIEMDPLRPATYRDLAMLNAYARNRFAEAVPYAEKLIELDPGAPYARCNLARLFVDIGDLDSALHVMELARERLSKSAEVYACIAMVHFYRDEEVEAARFARQALAIDPSLTDFDILVFGSADIKRGNHADARSRFSRVYPNMLKRGSPEILMYQVDDALKFVYVLRATGEVEQANALLDRAEQVIRDLPRLGETGYGIADVRILALRGEKVKALAALRAAEKAGWRVDWRFARDGEPTLSSIRNEPEFKAVFADIEQDMARQRAELAALH